MLKKRLEQRKPQARPPQEADCKGLDASLLRSLRGCVLRTGVKRKREQEVGLCLQFSSVAKSCPTLCDPMNRSMPSLPVHHQLPEFTQTHVHRVRDAIQSSHPLSSPSSPAQSLPASESFPISQLFV